MKQGGGVVARRRLWLGGVFLGGLLLAGPAGAGAEMAAGGGLGEMGSPLRERPPLPAFASPSAPELTLPPVESSPAERERLSGQARFFVRRIALSGATVFPEAELARLTAPYENREISSEELQELRQALTLHYVNKGYVNSGAIIPDQKVVEGVVAIKIVEGRLSGVEITGNARLREQYLADRLRLGLSGPLNMNELGQNVMALHESPLIRRLQGRLTPGEKPGEGILRANVEEENPWLLRFQFANDRAPSVGGERLESQVAHRNLTGWGDTLDFRGSITRGLGDVELSYERPLSARENTLRGWYSQSNSEVVEDPFRALDVQSKSENYGVAFNHPFIKNPHRELAAGLTLERRHGETFLLGEPYSFSAGADEGKTDVSALRLSQDFVLRTPVRVLALRNLFSLGLDLMGASDNGGEPNGKFFAWLGQCQWAERLPGGKGAQLVARADVQLANDPLLPLEKFAVGGATRVRGYRENQFVRDNGMIGSLELRMPVGRLPLFRWSKGLEDGAVQLIPFFDWGRSWNTAEATVKPEVVASCGLGLRWDPTAQLQMQLYLARALFAPGGAVSHNDLQDQGVHFKVVYQPAW